jgi:uncharacterized repeat protein (TIGR02543 family)
MKSILPLALIRQSFIYLVAGLLMSASILAQTLPTASQVVSQMTIGWNIGNSLEVPGGETGWGNPAVTQQLINAVKAAGFNSVRIPCAWDSHANATTYQIDAAWLARVKEVVDYCISINMYAIINIHWDGGWLEEHPLYSYQTAVNEKQNAYWTQIANYFKSYNERLLFAGTNEVHADYGTPTTEHITVQQSYLQTFVNAVRATGGNNSTRPLIVQTYNTNIWHGLDYFTLPTDPASNRLIVEVHHYDPYDFTLNTSGSCLYWGSLYPTQSACTWAQESYMDDLFSRVKTKWINNGIPVIIGEYGVIKRSSLTGQQLADHIASRQYYLKYVTGKAVENGIKLFYWDNGYNGNNGLALFDRNSGAVVDQGALNAIMEGAGIGNPNVNYTLTTSVNGSGTISRSPSGTSYPGGTSVTLTATAASGYNFVGWTGDLSGSTNPVTIIMNSNKNIVANFVAQGTGGSGTILREYWNNITGTAISSLTSNTNYPNNPTGSSQLTSLEGPVNNADNYGSRIRGYIHPPISGAYTFWVAGDDYTNLYLSTNDNPANATRIAYVEGWTNSREWGKYASQKSASVNLTAGQKYYIEVLQKEATGGDNVAVAWQGPTISQVVIDGAYLSPYVPNNNPTTYTLTSNTSGTGTISLSPSGGTYNAGTLVTVTATAGSGWQFNGWSGDLSGTTNPATITMNSNKTVTANFTQTQTTQYSLTVNVTGQGSVSLSPAGGTYASGTSVTLTATPVTGYRFVSWSGAITGSTNPVSTVMNANKTVTALFEVNQSTGCTNPVAISIPFVQNGAGNYCWVTTTAMAYINSWNLNSLKINGVDYTNIWSNSLPAAQNGQWFIEYSGSYAWSHFEAPQAKSSAPAAPLAIIKPQAKENKILLYPNPFTQSVNLDVDEPALVNRIVIFDQLGRTVETIYNANIKKSQSIGSSLKAGIYIVKIYGINRLQSFKVTKK